jgi:penicillin-binding protein 2
VSGRVGQLQLGIVIALGALTLRLTDLQLVRGASYRRLAEQNRLRLVPETAPRGLLLDRRDRILASNQTVFRVALVPQELEDLPGALARIGEIVGRSPDALRRQFLKSRSLTFIPATIIDRVPKETALRLEEEQWRLPGLLVSPETVRRYPLGSSASHLIGYLSQPTAEEFPLLKQYGVRPKELVGRSGLERLLDHALRGRSGGLMVEVNNRGHQVRTVGRRKPETGAAASLTIDAQLQSLIEEAFEAQTGACVVLDPATGELLAMVSRPAFRPEAFVDADVGLIRSYLNGVESPLMNRAVIGYQPGSIGKLVTAATALEAHLITPSTTIQCPGFLRIGDRDFHCWNRDGHGSLTLTGAIAQSCNVYFMQVARRLGLSRLRQGMEEAGFSRRAGWPFDEQPGHLPTRRLSEGEVALLGIGQGEILVSPLQAAMMASVFANGGSLIEPWVVRSVGGQATAHRGKRRRVGWSASTIQAVREGMREVIQGDEATGHRAYSPLITVAGKTGTAQTHVPGSSHGWFVGFCPVDEPRAAMAILAEHGGSGGDLPASIARTVCEYVQAQDAR